MVLMHVFSCMTQIQIWVFLGSDGDSFRMFSVRRLSAAASGQDPAQHCDGEGRRRLDGTGRVPGEERPVQR